MTLREILRLAIGSGIRFESPTPDTESYAPAAAPPPPEYLADLETRARAGEAAAQRELGILAYRGRGLPEDRAEAFKWLTLAARQGDRQAELSLEFIGPTISTEQAYEGRRRVSELTGEPLPPLPAFSPQDYDFNRPDPEQLYAQALESMRTNGLLGREEAGPVATPAPDTEAGLIRPILQPPPPPPRPLAWAVAGLALLALVGGVAAVLHFVGRDQREAARQTYSLQSGPADRSAAGPTNLAALRAAAARGEAKAQFEMGLASARGAGVPQDVAAAAEWYRQAALQRDIGAMNNLGVLYIQGTGVKRDFVQAYVWLHLAAQGGSSGSGRNRDQLALYMTAEQVAEAMRQAAAIRQTWAATATP